MKNPETTRVINGHRYRCRDTGCNDFDRAESNRFIVENQLFREAHMRAEAWFAHAPLGSPLPLWMPLGELPQVKGRGNGGDWFGINEVEELVVVDEDGG